MQKSRIFRKIAKRTLKGLCHEMNVFDGLNNKQLLSVHSVHTLIVFNIFLSLYSAKSYRKLTNHREGISEEGFS
jgi:hypothetical protein